MLANQQPQWVHTDAETDRMIEKEIETEICQRFIRLSCEKMLNARHERGGAKLHRNLLILHLLRKARSDSKRLPYECASLLKRPPMSGVSSAVTRHLSAGAVSPPQEHVFLSEAEVEHEDQEDSETLEENIKITVLESEDEDIDDEDVDVVSCDDEKPVHGIEPESGTITRVPSTYSFMVQEEKFEKPQQLTHHHIVMIGGPLEYKVRDQDESDKYNKRSSFRGNSLLLGHMANGLETRFEPLHLPFTSTDAIEEATDVASLLNDESEHSKVPELSDDLDQQLQMISPPISPPEAVRLVNNKLDLGQKFFDTTPSLDYDDDDSQPPQLFSCQESDDDDSGTEDDCDEEDDCEIDGLAKCKRRKRKTSTPRSTSVAEKRQCTADGDSDSGVDVDAECIETQQQTQPQIKAATPTLISVYSTGLGTTVVPQQQPSSSLPSSSMIDQQVPVLKRIHSYRLFCK